MPRRAIAIKSWRKTPAKSNWLAIAAFMVSVISLALSGWQFIDSRERDLAAKRSNIHLVVRGLQDGKVLFYRDAAPLYQGLRARIVGELLVINAGLVGDSILTWHAQFFERVAEPEGLMEHLDLMDDSVSVQLLDDHGSAAAFPQEVLARQTRRYLVSMSVLMDEQEMARNGVAVPLNTAISAGDVSHIFEKKGLRFLNQYYPRWKTPEGRVLQRDQLLGRRIRISLETSNGLISREFSFGAAGNGVGMEWD